MRQLKSIAVVLTLAGGAALAAERDFLTAEEVDKVRATQEPNARIQLYVGFAQQRAAQIEQLLSKERSGRSTLVHDLLEDYTNIIDALDTVTDDALRKKVDMTVGLTKVVPIEQALLAKLDKIEQGTQADRARYEFALKDAIDATEGSIELAGDLAQRGQDLAARDKREQDIRKEGNAPLTGDPPPAPEADPSKPAPKKAPTLRRPTDPPPRTK